MGHLLLVESWVGAMSTLLPRGIQEGGHRFSFVTRDLQHYLRARPTADPHPLLAAENVLTADTNHPAALLDFLERLQPILEFDGVATSCDYYLATAARAAERLALPGPPPTAVANACAKDRTRHALGAAGVPGPAFAVAESVAELTTAADTLGYPLVVKPVDLCAGMFVRKVDGPSELHDALADIRGFPINARGQQRSPRILLEELLTGPEVSVETVTFQGRTTVVGVTDKSVAGQPWFVETGHMFPATLDSETERQVTEIAVAAIETLGLDNTVGHTEVKLTPNGPRIVEVNPRPAGNQITELIRRVTGIDLAAVYAQLALGEKPDLHRVNTGAASAAIAFLLPPRAGEVTEIHGTEQLARDRAVADWRMSAAGRHVSPATSNNNYLGHVMVTSEHPGAARSAAENHVARLTVRYAEEVGA